MASVNEKNSMEEIMSKISSEERSNTKNGMPLMKIVMTDGRTLKSFFKFLEKIHSNLTLEFHSEGIYCVETKKSDNNDRNIIASSVFEIFEKDLLVYMIDKRLLVGEVPDENDLFFSLKIDSKNLLQSFNSISATATSPSEVTFTYNYNCKHMFCRENENINSTLIDVEFGFTMGKLEFDPQQYPQINSMDNNPPFIKIPMRSFTKNASYMTKKNGQLSYAMMIDLYDLDLWHRKMVVHSLEKKFHFEYIFGDYINEYRESIRYILDSKLLKNLTAMNSFSSNSIIEFYTYGDILRISVHVSFFGRYDIYIVSQK